MAKRKKKKSGIMKMFNKKNGALLMIILLTLAVKLFYLKESITEVLSSVTSWIIVFVFGILFVSILYDAFRVKVK